MNNPRRSALQIMDNTNNRAKSLKALAENKRWLDEHPNQTFHTGDLPRQIQPGQTDQTYHQQQ